MLATRPESSLVPVGSELAVPGVIGLREPQRFAVVLNANAKRVTRGLVRSVRRIVPSEDIFLSESEDHAIAFAKEIVLRGYRRVFIGGGDGTILNVVNHVFRQFEATWVRRIKLGGGRSSSVQERPPMPEFGVLRLGTGNAMAAVARSRAAMEDLRSAVEGRWQPSVPVDMLDVDGTLTPFAGLGWDAEILEDYDHFKRTVRNRLARLFTRSLLGYFTAIFARTIPRVLSSARANVRVVNRGQRCAYVDSRRGDRLVAVAPGTVLYEGPVSMLGAASIPFYGFKLRIFPFAGVAPGLLNLRIYSGGVAAALANLVGLWKGTWRSPRLNDYLVEDVEIESDKPFPFQVAGDTWARRDRIRFRTAEQSVKLINLVEPGQ